MISTRRLGPADLDRFLEVRAVSYPAPDIDQQLYRRLMSARLPHTSGLFVEENLACVATVYPTSMYLGGRRVSMGALAGVATTLEHRRRGYVRRLLLAELARMREEQVGWCLEYPFDPRFYHRLGWQSVPAGVELELPSEYLFSGKPPEARPMALQEFGSLAGVYDAWAARYDFTLTRIEDPREAWSRLVSDWWLDDPGYLYRLDGAYALFTLSREGGRTILTVEDFAYEHPAARAELFRLIGSMHGQAHSVRLYLPEDDPLALDHGSKHALTRRWPLQARIVDLHAALAPLTTEGPLSFSLRVRDELCEWNDGTFRVDAGPEGTNVSPAAQQADLEVPIQTLPLLLTGTLSPQAALHQGLASGSREALASLASLSTGRTPFMPSSDAF